MNYSIVVITSILIHLILNNEYFRNIVEKTEVNKAFTRYIWAALGYFVMDAVWGIIYDLHIPWLIYINSIFYYITMALTVVLLCRYVTTYLRLHTKFGRFINFFGLLFGVFEILLLITNHFVHIFFWIDSEGMYHAYGMRYVALYMQVLLCMLLVIQTGSVINTSFGEMRKRYISIQIVNMYEDEKNIKLGFSEKISEWLYNFGISGQVHEDDLKDYLEKTSLSYMREYFKNNSIQLITYRRKYGDIYKRVMMEIIPSNDYSEDNQSLFLYVKNIEK